MPVRSMTVAEWWAANPLAAWRRYTATTRDTVCARVGVGTTAVVKWERGGSTPTEPNMAKLAEIMEIDAATLAKAWERWGRRARG